MIKEKKIFAKGKGKFWLKKKPIFTNGKGIFCLSKRLFVLKEMGNLNFCLKEEAVLLREKTKEMGKFYF